LFCKTSHIVYVTPFNSLYLNKQNSSTYA
jgi:hypothetical protein